MIHGTKLYINSSKRIPWVVIGHILELRDNLLNYLCIYQTDIFILWINFELSHVKNLICLYQLFRTI